MHIVLSVSKLFHQNCNSFIPNLLSFFYKYFQIMLTLPLIFFEIFFWISSKYLYYLNFCTKFLEFKKKKKLKSLYLSCKIW